MKAYETRIGDVVALLDADIITPPGAIGVTCGEELIINKLDGMYVSAKNKDGDTVYIQAWTDVKIIRDEKK